MTQSVKAGLWTNGIYIHVYPHLPNTNTFNQYSVGTNVNNYGGSDLPLGSFCIDGTFKINSQTDSSIGSCAKMFLAMDLNGLIFTANYPYPNL